MSKLSILIVEDEKMIVTSLKTMISSFSLDIDRIDNTDNISDALDYIKTQKPNLVLLDIKIKDGNSFEILNQLDDIDFKVIFITAYQEFALKAFKYSAIDYLVKPLNTVDLENALKKASEALLKDQLLKIRTLHYNLNNPNHKLILNTLDELFIVDVKDIIACKSEGSYTQFILRDGPAILVSKPLKLYDELLQAHDFFFRIHKSYLINTEEIKKINKKEGGMVIMKNDLEVPIASSRWKDFLKKVSL